MEFLIEIKGNTQPELMHSLDEARKQLISGGCYLNVCGCINVTLKPKTDEDEDEFRRLYALSQDRKSVV